NRVERFLRDPDRAPVAGRAHPPRIGQPGHHALDRRVHRAGLDELVADQAPLRAVAFEPTLVLDRLPRDAVAGEARQPHIGRAGDDALPAGGAGPAGVTL